MKLPFNLLWIWYILLPILALLLIVQHLTLPQGRYREATMPQGRRRGGGNLIVCCQHVFAKFHEVLREASTLDPKGELTKATRSMATTLGMEDEFRALEEEEESPVDIPPLTPTQPPPPLPPCSDPNQNLASCTLPQIL